MQPDKKLKILFAEDDEIFFEYEKCVLQKSLKLEKCKGFHNGKALLDEFKNDKDYDLIILDIEMPVMCGLDCLIEIRKIDINIPVMALTAGLVNDRKKFLSLGFNEYITKPFAVTYLLDAIQKLIIDVK